MKRKDYLKTELSKEEKLYLKRIIMTARNKYIEKNYKYINNSNVTLSDTVIFSMSDTVIEAVLERCQEDLGSIIEFEKLFSNLKLYNIVKALSLKEKEVLFYLYKKQKSIKEIAAIMKINRKTVSRIRDKAQSKIVKKLLQGGC